MKLLAFDQSTTKSGYAVYQDKCLANYGLIDYSKENGKEILMQKTICNMIEQISPDCVVIEDVALQTNPSVLILLSRLQGAIIQTCSKNNITCFIIKPTEWRKKLEFKQGKGVKRKDLKIQAKDLVLNHFDLTVTEDVAEAICIGLATIK